MRYIVTGSRCRFSFWQTLPPSDPALPPHIFDAFPIFPALPGLLGFPPELPAALEEEEEEERLRLWLGGETLLTCSVISCHVTPGFWICSLAAALRLLLGLSTDALSAEEPELEPELLEQGPVEDAPSSSAVESLSVLVLTESVLDFFPDNFRRNNKAIGKGGGKSEERSSEEREEKKKRARKKRDGPLFS